jgi:hypothetical protein
MKRGKGKEKNVKQKNRNKKYEQKRRKKGMRNQEREKSGDGKIRRVKNKGKLSIPDAELLLLNTQIPPSLRLLRWKVLLWKEENDMFSVVEYKSLESRRKDTTGEAR